MTGISDILNFNFLATHFVLIGIFLILTLSLNLVNGCAGMFSLGHQGFWAVGAYGAGATVLLCGNALPGPVVFGLSLVGGVVAATVCGFLVGIPCLRLRGDYLAVATLGFAEIIRIILNNVEWLGGSRGLRMPSLVIGKSPDTAAQFFGFYLALIAFLVVITFMVCWNLVRSGHGRAILSLREDEVAAAYVGVPTTRYKVFTFAIGAAFAGLAGAVYANFFGVISPKDFGLMAGILLLLMVVLGGTGSFSGAVLATIVLYVAQQVLKLGLLGIPSSVAQMTGWQTLMEFAETCEQLAVERWQILFAVLLIVLMIGAPRGFLGNRELTDTRAFRWLARRLSALGKRGVSQC